MTASKELKSFIDAQVKLLNTACELENAEDLQAVGLTALLKQLTQQQRAERKRQLAPAYAGSLPERVNS